MSDDDGRLHYILVTDSLSTMVSVIMNTINEKPELLNRAIDSYISQPNCELIISTITGDPCVAALRRRYGSNIKMVKMPRKDHPCGQGGKSPKGSYLQLNNALPLITGNWFTFASGNDYSYPFKLALEKRICLIQKKEICYSAYDHAFPDGERKTQPFFSYDRARHQRGNFVSDCALISRRLVDKYLPFKVEMNNYAYWDLWLRIYKGEGDVFAYNSKPTWVYIQDHDAMHTQRKADPNKIRQAEIDKNTMLSLHK